MGLIEEHLNICGDCAEEFELLFQAVKAAGKQFIEFNDIRETRTRVYQLDLNGTNLL